MKTQPFRTRQIQLVQLFLGVALFVGLTSFSSAQNVTYNAVAADPDNCFIGRFAGHAIFLPDLDSNFPLVNFNTDTTDGFQFIFAPTPGTFVENVDGTGSLSGTLQSSLRPGYDFSVAVNFTGRTTAGSPFISGELSCNADTSMWHYYTTYTATLTGLHNYAGAHLTLTPTMLTHLFQVGNGTTNKNLLPGASGWFTWTVDSQPSNGHVLRNSADISQSWFGDFDFNIEQLTCPCTPHNIAYNFNGTQIIFQSTNGGSYVWFISDGKVTGLPSNQKVVLHVSNQSIVIPATKTSPQYTVGVPDAFITFDPTATVATATFDTGLNVWRMTYPSSSLSGNVFYGGAAFKVPAAGLPGGIKNVTWTGTFTTDTPGVKISWQWHAANYSNFTGDYNSIAPKPTDDNKASNYKNSDLAGTPEGTDPVTKKTWKSFVVGGASGGGGSNYTGSGSSTISFPPCVCSTP
jgi:hypothetical protein